MLTVCKVYVVVVVYIDEKCFQTHRFRLLRPRTTEVSSSSSSSVSRWRSSTATELDLRDKAFHKAMSGFTASPGLIFRRKRIH